MALSFLVGGTFIKINFDRDATGSGTVSGDKLRGNARPFIISWPFSYLLLYSSLSFSVSRSFSLKASRSSSTCASSGCERHFQDHIRSATSFLSDSLRRPRASRADLDTGGTSVVAVYPLAIKMSGCDVVDDALRVETKVWGAEPRKWARLYVTCLARHNSIPKYHTEVNSNHVGKTVPARHNHAWRGVIAKGTTDSPTPEHPPRIRELKSYSTQMCVHSW